MLSSDVQNSQSGLRNQNTVEIEPNHELAKIWLEIGTSCGWSIVPILRYDGVVGFGIYASDLFEKPGTRKKLAEDAEKFAQQKKSQAFFKLLNIEESLVLEIELKKVTELIPLPCETVLRNQLMQVWNEKILHMCR